MISSGGLTKTLDSVAFWAFPVNLRILHRDCPKGKGEKLANWRRHFSALMALAFYGHKGKSREKPCKA
jgi:hypothetical protein